MSVKIEQQNQQYRQAAPVMKNKLQNKIQWKKHCMMYVCKKSKKTERSYR